MKILFPLILIYLLSGYGIHAQEAGLITGKKSALNSSDLPHKGKLHCLIVYVQFTEDGEDLNSEIWPSGKLPGYADWILDTNPHGFKPNGDSTLHFIRSDNPKPRVPNITDYFLQMSLGQLLLTGDYYPRLIRVDARGKYSFQQANNAVVDSINKRQLLGLDPKMDMARFDNWTLPRPWLPKKNKPDGQIDLVMFIYRNSIFTGWNGAAGGIWNGYSGNLMGMAEDISFVLANGISNPYPLTIFSHELSHGFLGGNEFHVMGGAHSWNFKYGNTVNFGLNYGWGLIGGGNIFKSCNGWDRHRLGWESPDANMLFLEKATIPDSGITCKLRDFTLTGDVIRIKLPHIPDGQLQQYLWIENHKKESFFDKGFEIPPPDCYEDLFAPGIYMFMQTGMDDPGNLHVKRGDFLRPISAEGNYDYGFVDTLVKVCYAFAEERPVYKMEPNPLSGYNDLQYRFFDIGTPETGFVGDGVIMGSDYPSSRTTHSNNHCYYTAETEQTQDCFRAENKGNSGNIDCSPSWVMMEDDEIRVWQSTGPEERFTVGDEINIGTNPSTASVNYRYRHENKGGGFVPVVGEENKIYLNGISVKLVEKNEQGDYWIRIMKNQYNIDKEVRFAGNEIILSDTLVIGENGHLILDQSYTPNSCFQFGNGFFAPPTRLVVKKGAYIKIRKGGKVNLKNGSEIIVEEGAVLDVSKKGRFIICQGSELMINEGGKIRYRKKDIRDKGKFTIK